MFVNEFFNKKTVEAETQPNTGTRTVSSSAGTTTYDTAGKATQHATPRLGGMQKTTDLQTGRTTTSVDGAGISASQSTGGGITDVTSATMDLGAGTASVHRGVGFGGAGKDVQGPYQGSITNTATGATTNVVGRLPTRQDMGVEEGSTQDRLHRRHQELRKKSGLPDPDYYKELKASYDIEDDAKRLAQQAEIKKKYRVTEGLKFHGGIPDVDHMPGSVIRNADLITHNVKFTNKGDWDRATDKLNADIFDDMAEFRTDSKGESVTGNSAVWAYWDNASDTGWINVKGRQVKPHRLGEQGAKKSKQDLSQYSTERLQDYVKKVSGGGVPAFGSGAQLKRVQQELKRREQDVAEGEVLNFPKKHPYEQLTHCEKCGGELVGGRDEKGRLKFCMPCMTIYRAPNQKQVNEAGPFSYGAKKPRKGSVADLAAKKRKEQERGKQPIEPKDQMVGVAKVITNEDIEQYLEEMTRAGYDIVTEHATLCPECGGPAYNNQMLAEKQDACYSKVKSRYKVWPSAYASGALVRCRKVGAKNWGNKSKK
jgi:hypothetical protein